MKQAVGAAAVAAAAGVALWAYQRRENIDSTSSNSPEEHVVHCHEETIPSHDTAKTEHFKEVPVADTGGHKPNPANLLDAVSIAQADCECGFGRNMEQMLKNTVGEYDRHVFVATGHAAWPFDVVGPVDADRLQTYNEHTPQAENVSLETANSAQKTLRAVVSAVKGAKQLFQAARKTTKINACDERPHVDGTVDLLVFPDRIRVLGVTESTASAAVEVLTSPLIDAETVTLAGFRSEPIPQRYIMVCAHAARDSRCGTCGPALTTLFEAEITKMQQHQCIRVRKTSHVGGHAYAGNVLCFPSGSWFGYVTPESVPAVVSASLKAPQDTTEDSFGNYEINLRRLWRGQMGMKKEEQVALVEKWLAELPGRVSW